MKEIDVGVTWNEGHSSVFSADVTGFDLQPNASATLYTGVQGRAIVVSSEEAVIKDASGKTLGRIHVTEEEVAATNARHLMMTGRNLFGANARSDISQKYQACNVESGRPAWVVATQWHQTCHQVCSMAGRRCDDRMQDKATHKQHFMNAGPLPSCAECTQTDSYNCKSLYTGSTGRGCAAYKETCMESYGNEGCGCGRCSGLSTTSTPSLPAEVNCFGDTVICANRGNNGKLSVCMRMTYRLADSNYVMKDFQGSGQDYTMRLMDQNSVYGDGAGHVDYSHCAYQTGHAYASCANTHHGGKPMCTAGPAGAWLVGSKFKYDEAWLLQHFSGSSCPASTPPQLTDANLPAAPFIDLATGHCQANERRSYCGARLPSGSPTAMRLCYCLPHGGTRNACYSSVTRLRSTMQREYNMCRSSCFRACNDELIASFRKWNDEMRVVSIGQNMCVRSAGRDSRRRSGCYATANRQRQLLYAQRNSFYQVRNTCNRDCSSSDKVAQCEADSMNTQMRF